jgi:transposase InsO family protein
MPAAVAVSMLVPASNVLTGYPKLVSNQSSKPCCALLQRTLRSEVTAKLNDLPGRDIVLVSPDRRHPVHAAMLYNEPDLEGAEIIWAHRLGGGKDDAMLRHFHGRRVWNLVWLGDGTYVLKARNNPGG